MSNSPTLAASSALLVKTSQSQLSHALSLVSKAVAKHNIQPVLSNILIKASAEQKTLNLIATDLDLGLGIEIEAEVQQEGEVTVPAQKLTEIISKLPALDLTLTSSESALITIACGRSKFEIKGLSSEQFPQEFIQEANKQDENSIKLPIKHLQLASKLVSFASDKKEANSILNGICLELSEKGLELASTDGSRLAYYNAPGNATETSKKVIIPFRSLTELARLIAGLEEAEINCNLSGSNQIIFKTNNRVLSSSLIDGNYPKYQQLIPTDHSQKAILDRQAFTNALERVSVLANEKTKVIKLLFEEIGVLTISANAPDLGEAEDQIDLAEYSGENFSIAFNVNYMLDCLKNLDCTQIELSMSEPLKPIILRPVGEGEAEIKFDYLYLLMPVQMKTST